MKRLLPLIFIFLTTIAHAQTYSIDNRYSTINFRIQHIIGYATGVFKTMNGSIELNNEKNAVTKIQGTIDINSLDTNLADRDEDLRSERFFNAREFPVMTFQYKKITKDKIIGDLSLHGVTKEVTLDYQFLGTALDQYGQAKTALTLTGTINRKDFGVVYNTKTDDGKWLLGDQVELKIELEGIQQ